jgi:hypothetical protein
MLNFIQNNPLCATLVGLVAFLLGYFIAKTRCEQVEQTHTH